MKMKISNENETYTLHSYNCSAYQMVMDTCNGKQYQNNASTYEDTRNMIQDYFIKMNIFKYIRFSHLIYLTVTRYEMIIYEAMHVPTRGE